MSKENIKLFNSLILCIVLLGIASSLQQIKIPHFVFKKKEVEVPLVKPKLTYVPQFVLISFDGSKDTGLWKDLRVFKEQMKLEGKKINYTFFINAAYFLTADTRNFYNPPQNSQGHTNIGIADGIDDIRTRINEVNLAIGGGDEIASHTTGHHSGLGWTGEEWKKEFESFDSIIFNLDNLYSHAHLPKLNLTRKDIVGFRAPYLDTSPGLYETLHGSPRYRYDTSEILRGRDVWPTKDESGLWHIPLGILFAEGGRVPILAMDYNLYVHHSDAQDVLKKDTPEWKRAYDDMLASWLEYFYRNYNKDRAPVLVGYHFGHWNDGVYWEVMKEFARQVCGKAEVNCGTFKELVDYLDEYGVPKKE